MNPCPFKTAVCSEVPKAMFDLPALEASLAGTTFAGKLHFSPVTDSTNTDALGAARAGAPGGSVYFADEQLAGRGRGGHAWHSAAGQGLYVSILLRPSIPAARLALLPLAAGLAAADAIRATTGLAIDLRWPNDLLLGPRKVGGILIEAKTEASAVAYTVIGIGINVHQPQFPPELSPIATSLFIETGRNWPRQDLLLALLQSLDQELAALTGPGANIPSAAQSIRARLEKSSSWIRNKRVRVDEGEPFTGIAEGLDSRGFLQVRTPTGLRTVLSGGVRAA